VAEAVSPRREGLRPWLLSASALGLATTSLSLARFGYSVLLPAMRTDLHWSYTQAGGVNTANAIGYLAGAVAAAFVLGRLGEYRAFLVAFLLTGCSILLSAFTASYPALLCLRATAGAAGAVLFVSGATLAARLAEASSNPGLVLGVYFAGVGPGIVVSAILAPVVLSINGGWRIGWGAMGAVAVLCVIPAARVGRLFEGPPREASNRRSVHLRPLRWSLVAFTLYGLGYVSFMTFIVARYREVGASVLNVTLFWAVLGAAATASGWPWRSLLEREGGFPLAVLLFLSTVGAALPLLGRGIVYMLGSALIFGCTFLGVVAAMAQLVRRSLPEAAWGSALATSTALFAAGQTVGPFLTGVLADRTGDLSTGLAVSAGFLGFACLVATRQRPSARSGGRSRPEHRSPTGSAS
jgi:predicted MFS family arabinose efflux permease